MIEEDPHHSISEKIELEVSKHDVFNFAKSVAKESDLSKVSIASSLSMLAWRPVFLQDFSLSEFFLGSSLTSFSVKTSCLLTSSSIFSLIE